MCDYAMLEDETKKCSAIGFFEKIFTKTFPVVQKLFLVVGITDGLQKCPIDILLINESDGSVLCKGNMMYNFQNPRAAIVNILQMNIEFKMAGNYSFLVKYEGQILGTLPFNVEKINA